MTRDDKETYKNLAFDKQNNFRVSEQSLLNMNEGLIKRWNDRVKPEDTVFHIGDFCFKNSLNSKPKQKIRKIRKEQGKVKTLTKLYGKFVVTYIACYVVFAVVLSIVSYIKFVR